MGKPMTLLGHVKNGVIVLDGNGNLDEGTPVRVEPLNPTSSVEEWRRDILATAGKWQGEFERPEQGDYEQREPLP